LSTKDVTGWRGLFALVAAGIALVRAPAPVDSAAPNNSTPSASHDRRLLRAYTAASRNAPRPARSIAMHALREADRHLIGL